MFDKILIANRGEIACRIIKTCRRLGIATVAVYSEADQGGLHVEMADEAVYLGPAQSSESYLRTDRLLDACKQTGAQAVHPGYGFVSENEDFARALDAEGITFIGPPAGAIAAMGDKIQSKTLAQEAGVNTIPGYTGTVANAEEAVRIARDVGYPVMLKASAGGGGKGMRIARDDEECRDGFERATSEAQSSFSDARVFIERFIEEPRHIEIQVLADKHGNVIHLNERECSIQRRHQKVIEEAPSPFLDPETRAEMGRQACALARAVDYCSAGTVEFIVDRDRSFFFLEMNTRLQVEHPVTEMVTGQDLVEWMIRVATGERLTLEQDAVPMDGWALESRVYAEDPYRGFLPSIGRLAHVLPPEEGPHVRVDTGVMEGSEISMFYDPMIAKLVTHGSTRGQAIERMRKALDAYYIRGVSHNVPFLASVLAKPRFVEGRLSTNFIPEEYPEGFSTAHLPPEDPDILIAVAATVHRIGADRNAYISDQLAGHHKQLREDWVVIMGDEHHPVRVQRHEDGSCHVLVGERTFTVVTDWNLGNPLFHGTLNGDPVHVQIDRSNVGWRLFHAGGQAEMKVLTPRAAELAALMPKKEAADLSRFLLSPMPGLLVNVLVEAGQEVKAGEMLAVVEAMKMENVLRAEQDGTVARVHASPGDSLAVDQAILEFE